MTIDLNEAEGRIAERIGGLATRDIRVTVEIVPAGWLDVHVSSLHPVTFWHESIDLHADGRIDLPEPDDGCAPLSAPGSTLGPAGTVEEAVELIVPYAEKAIDALRERQARALARALPAEQPPVGDADLTAACALWQSERDGGSSLVRGAARALTAIDHYFHAGFIAAYEAEARRSRPALAAAIALLRGVNSAAHRDADGWCAATGLPAGGFAGRGLTEKPDEDEQILRTLRQGRITMPLWGVSLSRKVADSFGTRFLFEIVGEFPAVPAWVASRSKDDEQEIVTGGWYRVLSMADDGPTTRVRLEWVGAAGDKVGSDPLLLEVLGAVDGVGRSSLIRNGATEKLSVRLGGYGESAEVEHGRGEPQVQVRRQYPPRPEDYPNHYRPDEWSEYLVLLKATVTSTVPADVDSILAAITRPRPA